MEAISKKSFPKAIFSGFFFSLSVFIKKKKKKLIWKFLLLRSTYFSSGILISSQEKAAVADRFLCVHFNANMSSNQ